MKTRRSNWRLVGFIAGIVLVCVFLLTACPRVCFHNGDCSSGDYCEKAEAACATMGLCVEKPEVCTEIYSPVCGCDGETYSNACHAAGAGVNVASHGSCGAACAKEGESFSQVYGDLPDDCCEGLTEWFSGMDTRVSIGSGCYETGLLAGSPTGTCINCGNGICEDIEDVCSCPGDCEGGTNSDYVTAEDFCLENKDRVTALQCRLGLSPTPENTFKRLVCELCWDL